MRQRERWAAKVEAQKPTQSEQPACETLFSRVAWLRRWRNSCTGETCQQTTAEFAQLKGISLARAKCLTKSGEEKGWRHEAKLHKTIQGDAVTWLTEGRITRGSKSLQAKETIASAWDHAAVILALYNRGSGIKAIAKQFNLQPRAVMLLLIQTGINTSKRRNYDKRKKPIRTLTAPRAAYDRIMMEPERRLKKQVMGRIWQAMKRQSVNATGSFALVGCTAAELREHIAKQFADGMSFDNYGKWHVDHIRPCASFDLTDPDQMKACFNWINLRPLWAAENIRKGAKYAKG